MKSLLISTLFRSYSFAASCFLLRAAHTWNNWDSYSDNNVPKSIETLKISRRISLTDFGTEKQAHTRSGVHVPNDMIWFDLFFSLFVFFFYFDIWYDRGKNRLLKLR